MEKKRLEEALATLGDLLAERAQSAEILVIGGASLLLLGFIERPTADVDVVGYSSPDGYIRAEQIPGFLAEAVDDVGQALGLGTRWLNVGPAGLLEFGLPPGLEERISIRRYGSLGVHLPGREDLICFKLYAIVDQGPASKHVADLHRLHPSRQELVAAARWTRTHDPSSAFLGELREALRFLDVEAEDDEL